MSRVVLPGSFGLRTARGLGEAMSRLPYEYDELLVHLSNRLKLLDAAVARNRTFLGRMYNRFTGEDLDSVELDGLVVTQLFKLTGEEPPIPVNVKSRYRVDHENLRQWYELAVKVKSDSRGARGGRR